MIVCLVKRSEKIGNHGRKLRSGGNRARRNFFCIYLKFIMTNTYEIDYVQTDEQENEFFSLFFVYHL